MVQVPTSMRPDSTVPFFVVLWEANSPWGARKGLARHERHAI